MPAQPHRVDRQQVVRRQRRQGLPRLFEHRHHLGHDIGQQDADDEHGDHRDDRRIDQRDADLLPQHLAALEVGREALHHLRQRPRLLAGLDDRAVVAREGRRVAAEGLPQSVARDDVLMHAGQHPAHAFVVLLLDQRRQRPFDAEPRRQQGRELARKQRQRQGGNAPAAARALRRGIARRHALCQQALLPQPGAHRARVVGFQLAAVAHAAAVDGDVAPRRHAASRVTRSTSSTEVSPDRIQRRPSWRRRCMPCDSACCRIRCSPALSWMSRRSGSSMVSNS